jgi:hypothetical protein
VRWPTKALRHCIIYAMKAFVNFLSMISSYKEDRICTLSMGRYISSASSIFACCWKLIAIAKWYFFWKMLSSMRPTSDRCLLLESCSSSRGLWWKTRLMLASMAWI